MNNNNIQSNSSAKKITRSSKVLKMINLKRYIVSDILKLKLAIANMLSHRKFVFGRNHSDIAQFFILLGE